MEQHTPGPWDMRDDDKRITIGCGLVEGPNGYDVAEVYNDDCPREVGEANARLIAAAPELLEALVQMEAETSDYMLINNLGDPAKQHTISAARAAIAKALGE